MNLLYLFNTLGSNNSIKHAPDFRVKLNTKVNDLLVDRNHPTLDPLHHCLKVAGRSLALHQISLKRSGKLFVLVAPDLTPIFDAQELECLSIVSLESGRGIWAGGQFTHHLEREVTTELMEECGEIHILKQTDVDLAILADLNEPATRQNPSQFTAERCKILLLDSGFFGPHIIKGLLTLLGFRKLV